MSVIPSGYDNALCPSSSVGVPFKPNPVTVNNGVTLKVADDNPNRKEIIIQNNGATVIALKFGSPANYATGNYHVLLLACSAARDGSGGVYVSDLWKGAVFADSSVAGGEINVVEEL